MPMTVFPRMGVTPVYLGRLTTFLDFFVPSEEPFFCPLSLKDYLILIYCHQHPNSSASASASAYAASPL
jgi:hypothetical protein